MRTVEITPDNLPAFKNYLYPDMYERLQGGHTALGIGLAEKNFACGAVAGTFLKGGREFSIGSLYVDESLRMYGGGEMLLRELCGRLSGKVRRAFVSYSVSGGAERAMKSLLMKNGFEAPEKVSDIFYVKGTSIKGTALFPTEQKPRDKNIVQLFSLDDKTLGALNGDDAIPDYLDYKVDEDEADRDGSLAYMKNGRVAAYVIFKPVGDKTLMLTAAYTEKGSRGLFLRLIPECVRALAAKYGEDTVCVISALDSRVALLIEKLSEGRLETRLTEFRSERIF